MLCIRKQFLHKVWPIQLAFLHFILCMMFFPPLTVILPNFSHDQSNWSFTSFSSITFHYFQNISDLLSELSQFQNHTKLCPKFGISLVSSFFQSNLLVKSHLLSECSFCLGSPGLNFTCISCWFSHGFHATYMTTSACKCHHTFHLLY